MEDLEIECDWSKADYINITENDAGKITVNVTDEDGCSCVILSPSKAKQLRDWIDAFLEKQNENK